MELKFHDNTFKQAPQFEKTQEFKGIQICQSIINSSQNENNNNSLEQIQQQKKQHSQNQDVTIKKQYLKCYQDKLPEEIENENILNQIKIINNEEIDLTQKIDNLFDNHKQKNCSCPSQKYILYRELLKKQYTIENYINSGGNACVYEGYFLKDGIKEKCALKIIFDTPSEEIKQEIEIMKSFEKPINVVKIIDSFQIGEQFILILEKCQYSLLDEIKQIKQKQVIFEIEKLLQLILDLIDGLIQFRVYNILHLDIKPGNILVTKDGNYCYSDFGTSYVIKQNQEIEGKGFTEKYASPEQLNNEKCIDYQSDVYSLGITLKRIISDFKKFNEEYKNKEGNIVEFINDLEEIIQNNMIQIKSSDRLECQKLHELILKKYYDLNSQKLIIYFVSYKNKLNQILDLYSYSQNKDIPYILQLKLFYSQTQLILNNTFPRIEEIILFYQNYGGSEQQNQLKQYENKFQYLADELQLNQNHTNKNKFIYNSKVMQYTMDSNYFKNMGQRYRDIGDQKKGLIFELVCLEIRKQYLSKNNRLIADSLDIIGSCYKKLGENEIGLNYQIESLEIRKQIYKGNHENISASLNNIGQCYMDIGDYEKCLKYTEESLEMNKYVCEGNHISIVSALNNIAQCYSMLNDKQSCLRYQLESLLMVKQILNGCHPQLAQIINNLGVNYLQLDNKKKSLKYQVKSLEIKRQVMEGSHAEIALSLYDLGDLCLQLDEYEKGLKYLLESLEMRKQIFHRNHPEISSTLNKIGILYFKSSKYQIGLQYQFESLQMLKLFDGNNPNIVIFLSNLGKSYEQMGDFQNSLKYNLQSLDIAEQIYEAKNDIILNKLCDVKINYDNVNDEKNSLKYSIRILEFRKQFESSKTLKLAQQHLEIAQRCFNNDEKQNGIKLVLDCIEIKRQFYQGNNSEIVYHLNSLSTICSQLGDVQNSLKYQLEGLQINKQIKHHNHLDIAIMLFFVGSNYYKLGDYRKAINYSLEALIMRKNLFQQYDQKCLSIIRIIKKSYKQVQDSAKYLKYKLKYEQKKKQSLNIL